MTHSASTPETAVRKKKLLLSNFAGPLAGLSAALVAIALLNSQYLYAQAVLWLQPSAGMGVNLLAEQNEVRVGNDPRIIIPSLNVDAPVVYGMTRTDEQSVQKALERGVLHFAGTALPGERGNAVFVGHSSNSVWAPGDYKFVFALLERLNEGDQYAITYKGIRYVYRVGAKTIVAPSDVSVMKSDGTAVSTLITCTPVGTNLRRLVIRGEQISPQQTRERSTAEPALGLDALPGT